ncbi:hypothetical protein [Levilactobacillus yiduensis]|uniref:hypothetical protein n=1 Tax=Levilactobacillus yiduensis TaxID=2953880 RepID=UPI00215731C9|nr:hypothetical protein [Levilactobacillus yiduensis]
MTEAKTKRVAKATYDKAGLVNSTGFYNIQRAILNITLKDGKEYTLDEAKNQIKKFKGGI